MRAVSPGAGLEGSVDERAARADDRRVRLLRSLLLAVALLGCHRVAPADGDASSKPLPESSAQGAELKQRGVGWENGEIRAFYLARVKAIGAAHERWKKEGVPAVERARRAFQMRHDARVLARAMMKAEAEVEALR